MIQKRFFAMVITALFIASTVVPAFASDLPIPSERSAAGTDSGESTPFVQCPTSAPGEVDGSASQPADVTGDLDDPPPAVSASPGDEMTPAAPSFGVEVVVDELGYGLMGKLSELPEDAAHIRPLISVDGGNDQETAYEWAVPDENVGEDALEALQTQICIRGWDEPFAAYLRGEASALSVKLRVTTADGGVYDTEPTELARGETIPPPEEPPAFATEMEDTGQGLWLFGVFTGFTPDIKAVVPVYSLDGEAYQPIANAEPWDLTLTAQSTGMHSLTRQPCSLPSMEPLRSYLDGTLDEFFVKLQITTWSGAVYDTQPSRVSREPDNQPEKLVAVAGWPDSMRARDGRGQPYYGKVQVTAREGTTAAELTALLPDTLPIEIQLMERDENGVLQMVDGGILPYPVEWTLPGDISLTAQDGAVVFRSAIAEPVIPAGQEVSMVDAVYRLPDGAAFDTAYMSTEVRLWVNVLPSDTGADIALSDQTGVGSGPLPLSLAFHQKPSGATAIHYFYYYDGMEDWAEAGELLTQKSVDAKPGNPASEYYTLFTSEQRPYNTYLAGEIPGFLVGVEIKDGVFDGERYTMKWPGDFEMPPRVPDFIGSGGNQNGAGSGDGNGDSTDEGQRPELPQEPQEPPLTINPPSGGGTSGDSSSEEDDPPKRPNLPLPVDPPKRPNLPLLVDPPSVGDASDDPPLKDDEPSKQLPTTDPEPPELLPPQGITAPPTDEMPQETLPDNRPEEGAPASAVPSPAPTDSTRPAMATGDDTVKKGSPTPEESEAETLSAPPPDPHTAPSDTKQRPKRETEARDQARGVPVAATAAVVLTGGVIAVIVGASTAGGTVAGSSLMDRIHIVIRGLFSRK